MATVVVLDSALRPLCATGGPVTILTFMDSTGIHALVRASQELKERGCIIIHGVDGNAHLRKVLGLTRVDDVKNIHLLECDIL
jgi:anti-anti-sigma regulatory factor